MKSIEKGDRVICYGTSSGRWDPDGGTGLLGYYVGRKGTVVYIEPTNPIVVTVQLDGESVYCYHPKQVRRLKKKGS